MIWNASSDILALTYYSSETQIAGQLNVHIHNQSAILTGVKTTYKGNDNVFQIKKKWIFLPVEYNLSSKIET